VGVLHKIKILKHAELAAEATFPAVILRLRGMFSYAMLRMWMRPNSFNEELVDLPPRHKTIRNKWVLKVKRKSDDSIDTNKACLGAKGYTQ
jgi:hypothetical protein